MIIDVLYIQLWYTIKESIKGMVVSSTIEVHSRGNMGKQGNQSFQSFGVPALADPKILLILQGPNREPYSAPKKGPPWKF